MKIKLNYKTNGTLMFTDISIISVRQFEIFIVKYFEERVLYRGSLEIYDENKNIIATEKIDLENNNVCIKRILKKFQNYYELEHLSE